MERSRRTARLRTSPLSSANDSVECITRPMITSPCASGVPSSGSPSKPILS
jgi:hypothetical protein